MARGMTILCFIALLAGGCGEMKKAVSMEETLAGAVIDARGSALPVSVALNTDYLLLYFSAHWCPPCQAFTPKLVDFYNTQNGGTLFQVLFISSDRGEKEMLAYMQKTHMPWPGVVFHSDATKTLNKHYSGQGIPRLVLVNRDGKVLADSFKGREYLGPQAVIEELKEILSKRQVDPVGLSETTNETLPTPDKLARKFKVNGFGQGSKQDIAIINGKFTAEGAELEKGVVVEDITTTYVEVSYEGNLYRLYP
jgi:thiol-disulfide isomerase/thioredoxin